MKVSIITSSFNRVQTIGDAIRSVLNQDWKDIEYIIVDGSSRDGSLDIIKKYEMYTKSKEFVKEHPNFC